MDSSENTQIEKFVPAPTIRGSYNTYEDRTRRDLVDALGHVVDLELEGLVSIEAGAWGHALRLYVKPNVEVTIKDLPDGRKKIYLNPK